MNLINDFFYPTLKFLGLYHASSTQKLSKELCDWLDEYNPEVLYGQASSMGAIQFCQMVQEYLNKPLIFHMMDDWATMLKSEGIFGRFWYNRVEKEFQSLFDKSNILLSISELMAKEYKTRYNKDFIPFHNPIDVEFWKKHRKENKALCDPPVILYAGRVGTGIETSLEVIAKSVELVNKQTGIGLQFALQTPEAPKWISNYKYTRHNSYVEYKELPKVFAEADFLILPYDFGEEGLNFIRLSMPTKASEYFASGTPVIIFSPDCTAVVDYAEKHQCALSVTQNDSKKLAESIIELINDEDLRLKTAQSGVEIADKYHNAIEVRLTFQNILRSLKHK
ncbi:glycosyltransferase [Belliella marina]|uniref:Glycosyltransferase n=1 Tax=Belliella marina TaxID=1644146 RepID=A0ABW4VMA8_9BACT